MVVATAKALLLAAIESPLIFVAFASLSEVFRSILGVAKGTGFASFFRIRGLRVVEFRKRNHRAKREKH
jgi:hypothetical protein